MSYDNFVLRIRRLKELFPNSFSKFNLDEYKKLNNSCMEMEFSEIKEVEKRVQESEFISLEELTTKIEKIISQLKIEYPDAKIKIRNNVFLTVVGTYKVKLNKSGNFLVLLNNFLNDKVVFSYKDKKLKILIGNYFLEVPINIKKVNNIGVYFRKIEHKNNLSLIQFLNKIEKELF